MSDRKLWALILGASSGFGGATSRALARKGYSIIGVHLDRRQTMHLVEEVKVAIKEAGGEALFFNVNAASEEKREQVYAGIKERFATGEHELRVVLHSLAFGTLKPYFAGQGDSIESKGMNMTLDVMAHSLVYWIQGLVRHDLLAEGGRIFAMTSAGSERVWRSYGAVSAAKAALESHIRQLALELSPRGITANALRAGVTDTPALRKIPGNDKMLETARARNPGGRLTTPEDVARSIAVLADPALGWLTGNVINIDGGENISD